MNYLKIRIILVSALIFSLTSCSAKNSYRELIGGQAPYARLFMLDGDLKLLEEYRGGTVLLVFWASWCAKSKGVVRELGDVALQLKSYDPSGHVVMVAVEKNEKRDEVRQFIIDKKLQFADQVFSGNEIYDECYAAFRGDMVPLVFLIDRKGEILVASDGLDEVKRYLSTLHH